MSDSAAEIAHTLLRLGVLNPPDPEQQQLREHLLSAPALYQEVSRRLDAVGYELVQFLGHLGVRSGRGVEVAAGGARNNLGLDARHVRVLVYLWVQLLYREIKLAVREEEDEPAGRHQTLFGFEPDTEQPPALPVSELEAEFSETTSKSVLKGVMTTLRRQGFVQYGRDRTELQAGPALYVLIDHERMEEHVVRLARRGTLALPEDEGEVEGKVEESD